ncbi:MAG: hypothetical protein F4Y92_00725 [Dehalococcoidia bacterium]|nr:hypothetical protein [Dehalococcoidia bacterium]
MTISIRRAGAVLLGLVFLLALFLVLAGLAANATIARSGFVSDQLEEADAYQFVLDDLVPALLEDAWQLDADEFGLEFEENPLAASGLTPEQVAGAIRRAIPPEDLEALVSPAIEGAMDYVIGREEEVAIRLDAGANLDALVLELTTLFRETGAYERLLERELTPVFARWVDEGLPPGGEDSAWVAILRGASGEEGGSLARVFTHVATPEWMAAQVEGAANAGVDYAVARSDTLAIRIGFDENEVEQAAAEIAAVITEADAFDVAYTNVVEPATRESIPEVSTLPYGVVLTRNEVVEAVRDAVAGDWLDAQAAVLAADVAAYATGQTDTFATTFDLAAAKPEAWHALTAIATTSLRQALRDLPECATAAENGAARAALDRELPSCIPWDVPPADIVAIAVPAIATAIDETVLDRIPDLVTYSEQDLRDNLERDGGSDALLALDEIRELFREGWTYTDDDLRADLDEDAFDLIQDARLALSTGYVLQASDESPEGLEEGLDEVRDAIALGAGDLWIPALIAAALLLLIGFLGGRSWRGRFAWAAGVLLLSAAVLAVLFWTVAQSVSDGALDDIREEIALDSDSQFPSTSEALADKLVDVAASAVDDVAGNIARNALILAAVGAVGVIVAVFWGRIGAALGRDQL